MDMKHYPKVAAMAVAAMMDRNTSEMKVAEVDETYTHADRTWPIYSVEYVRAWDKQTFRNQCAIVDGEFTGQPKGSASVVWRSVGVVAPGEPGRWRTDVSDERIRAQITGTKAKPKMKVTVFQADLSPIVREESIAAA